MFTVEDHIRLNRVGVAVPSPDGSWLAVAVERLDRDGVKYVSDLWRVPVDGSGAVRLTRGDSRDTAPWFRFDGALGFLSNRQPNEVEPDEDAEKRMQVWVLPAEGGEPLQVTDEPLGVEAFRFARAADRLVLFAPVLRDVPLDKQRETARERAKKGTSARHFRGQPVRHWDHWLHDNEDLPSTHLITYSGSGGGRVDRTPDARREFAIEPELDITGDGKRIAATWQTTGADRVLDTSVLLVDLDAGARIILGAARNTNNEQPRFSPDGEVLAVVRSVRSPERAMDPTITLIDLDGGGERSLPDPWDIWPSLGGWTPDGRALVVTADRNGDTPVFLVDARTGETVRVAPESPGGFGSVHMLPDGRVAGVRSTLVEAPECFVVDPAGEAGPRTLARLSGFEPADWAEIERCRAASADGTEVQFFMVKPREVKGPLPTLMWIHGGPIGMNADAWHWRWNPLIAVAAGYAVALPNPRGSSGFGQDFIQGIWGNVWGRECYEDLMAVADELEKRSDVDSSRIMAMGGSFGGYMANWIGTQTDRFRCLVTHASIFTMAHFTGVTDHSAWWCLEMGGEDPYRDQAAFDRYAPVQHVGNWKTPTLVIHGERDYRCPISEGLNLFEALQHHRVESELLIFPDENHWILKPRNAVVWYETVLGFVARHMKAEGGRGEAGRDSSETPKTASTSGG